MRAVIVSFRRSGNNQYEKYALIRIDGVEDYKSAHKYIGKKVVWIHPKTRLKIHGKIIKVHGKNGVVLASFRKGLPGQALGTPVELR